MKFLLLSVLFISTYTYACPNLAGNYASCRSLSGDDAGSYDVVVTQKIENGATIYTISQVDAETHEREEDSFIADGQVRVTEEVDPDLGFSVKQTTVFGCVDNKVIGQVAVEIFEENAALINLEISKDNDELVIKSVGQVFGEEFEDTEFCK
jgi:hypothetical protein